MNKMELYYEESVLKALECCIQYDNKEHAYDLIEETHWTKYDVDSIKEYVDGGIVQIYLDKVMMDGTLYDDESRELIIEIEKKGIELYNEGSYENEEMELEESVEHVNNTYYGIMMAKTGKCPRCSDEGKKEFEKWVHDYDIEKKNP